MDVFLGYVLAQIICNSSGYDCRAEPLSTEIHRTLTDCQWERDVKSAYYKDLDCVKVRGKSDDQDGQFDKY